MKVVQLAEMFFETVLLLETKFHFIQPSIQPLPKFKYLSFLFPKIRYKYLKAKVRRVNVFALFINLHLPIGLKSDINLNVSIYQKGFTYKQSTLM